MPFHTSQGEAQSPSHNLGAPQATLYTQILAVCWLHPNRFALTIPLPEVLSSGGCLARARLLWVSLHKCLPLPPCRPKAVTPLS